MIVFLRQMLERIILLFFLLILRVRTQNALLQRFNLIVVILISFAMTIKCPTLPYLNSGGKQKFSVTKS